MKLFSSLLCCVLLLSLTISSCKKHNDNNVVVPKVGLVSGVGGFSDAGFNQSIYSGFIHATKTLPLHCEARESFSTADISSNINYFVNNGFSLVITVGYQAAQFTQDAAKAHPGIGFSILDYSYDTIRPNVECVVFDVDQGSFPCGFLAAWWSNSHNPMTPKVGFVGGPDIPGIRQFSVSYTKGVEYFNTKYNKNVQTLGCYATSFGDTLEGARLADSLLKLNVNTIFAFAGQTGNGALYKVKEAGRWAIGVDVDQYNSIPAVGSVLLTSCMKQLGVVTYAILTDYTLGAFAGGNVIHGNLANNGVGLAPFHEYELFIPDSINRAINTIENGIIAGTIKTGWPEK
jgi:basic membrane protein A